MMIFTALKKIDCAMDEPIGMPLGYPSRLIDDFTQPIETPTQPVPTEVLGDDQFDLELAQRILQRINSRVPGRIRHLTVYTTANAVVLAGQCSTYYTKQLAQHVAMGVLEYEQLINNIEVW